MHNYIYDYSCQQYIWSPTDLIWLRHIRTLDTYDLLSIEPLNKWWRFMIIPEIALDSLFVSE